MTFPKANHPWRQYSEPPKLAEFRRSFGAVHAHLADRYSRDKLIESLRRGEFDVQSVTRVRDLLNNVLIQTTEEKR